MYKPIDIHVLKINQAFRWWLTRDNFFTEDECNEVREYIDNNAKPKIGSYSIIDEQPIMEDEICKLNITDIEEQKYLDLTDGMIFWVNSENTVQNEAYRKLNDKQALNTKNQVTLDILSNIIVYTKI